MGVPESLAEVPIMRRIKVAAIAGGMMMAVSGCNGNGGRTVEVDGHVFHVPKEHLVQGTIPWLPVGQSEGLKFVINPGAQLKEQMIVTIESTTTTCHPKTPPTSSQLASACSAASQEDNSGNVAQNFALEKVYRNGDPTQWEYRLKGQGTVIASCYALSDNGEAGLCTSLGHYRGLVYSVGLRDSDVERLPSIREKVNGLLLSWEAASGNG